LLNIKNPTSRKKWGFVALLFFSNYFAVFDAAFLGAAAAFFGAGAPLLIAFAFRAIFKSPGRLPGRFPHRLVQLLIF
tara:strand:- start:102 stop:332 length:231 start_codon:yes stop_codon:yes gene_type:complete